MDAYSVLCASAIAAVVVTRSVTAAAFPLFTPTLLRNLGTEWGLTVFAFLSLACCPLPFLLFVSEARQALREDETDIHISWTYSDMDNNCAHILHMLARLLPPL